MRQTLVLLYAALGGLLIGTTLAFAHVEGNTKFIDSGNDWCEYGRAAITAEDRYTAATVWSYKGACTNFKPKSPGKLRTKANLLREGNDGEWHMCDEGYFGYNTSETYATSLLTNYGGRPCAEGSYKVRGLVALEDDGDWKGGTVDSPRHHW